MIIVDTQRLRYYTPAIETTNPGDETMFTKDECLASLNAQTVQTGRNSWKDDTHSFKIVRSGNGYKVSAQKLPGAVFTMRDALRSYLVAA